MGSPEICCIDIYISFFHNVSHKKKIASQSLSITAIFVSSPNGKERCVSRQNGCTGDQLQIPTSSDQRIIVSSRKVPSDKGTKEALRDKTKNCCTKEHE